MRGEEKKKWNWQYHCRSALKGRRSAPLHWSRDVYSGRRRRGRVPLCHRLLCRLTFQLVVIRSSPCLGASFSASFQDIKSRKIARICRVAFYPSTFSPIMKRTIRGGEKLEEVKLPANIYGSLCPLSLPLSLTLSLSRSLFLFFFFYLFPTSYMFILAWNLPLICCAFSPTAASD